MEKTLRTCRKGHQYFKSSDCPTCPICAKETKPEGGFLSLLGSPARNTLLHHGIDTLEKLASHTEKEILGLHGMGKKSIPTLVAALENEGIAFKKSNLD